MAATTELSATTGGEYTSAFGPPAPFDFARPARWPTVFCFHARRESLLSLRLLGRLPLKIDAARSGGRRPRSLDGGNRGPGWRVGAAPAAYLWGFEIGA